MIRFTWLQFRTQAILGVGALALLAIVLAVTGQNLVHLYDTNVATCKANNDCSTATVEFLTTYNLLQTALGFLVIAMPGVLGIFWGAPLIARELEADTYRLAWTQSVTRTHWSAVKIGVIGLGTAIVAGLLSLMVTWWFSPIDQVTMNRFTPPVFDERGLVPIGYAALAFMLGVTAGVLIRRTLAAMAVTLVTFIAVRAALTLWVFPNLIAPSITSMPVTSNSSLGFSPGPAGITFVADGRMTIPNGWVLSNQLVDKAGRAPTPTALHQFLETACPSVVALPGEAPNPQLKRRPANQADFNDCIAQIAATYHEAVTYQPADRYWTFQWYAMSIYFGLAGVLAWLCFWWIRRRLS